MHSLLARTRWVVLLAWCCGLNSVALLGRPVTGEPATDDTGVASSKSIETSNGPKSGLSFPSALPAEMPFRGDAELFPSATRATGSVVLLVGFILIGAFLLKRYWPGRFGAVAGERHIEVLETVALGERQSLTLVQVGQSRLLLARTAGSITLLDRAEIAPDTAIDSEMEALPGRPEENRNDVSAAVTAAASTLKLLQGSLKTGWAGLKGALRRVPSKPRTPAVPASSFEQVMRAELSVTAVTTAHAAATRSRLSEIRSRLQAD